MTFVNHTEGIEVDIFFIQDIYNLGPFPTPILSELRQKFSLQQTSENMKIKQTNMDQSKSKVSCVGVLEVNVNISGLSCVCQYCVCYCQSKTISCLFFV